MPNQNQIWKSSSFQFLCLHSFFLAQERREIHDNLFIQYLKPSSTQAPLEETIGDFWHCVAHHQVSELYLNVFQLQHDLNSGGGCCDVDGTYGRHQGVMQHIQIKPFSQENSFFAAECIFAFGGKYSIFIITLPMKVKCARYWPKTGKAIFSDTEVSTTMLNAFFFYYNVQL